MKVTWHFSASTASLLGYGLLLLALAALGFFVPSLALGSGLALGFAIGLIVFLTGSVMGFRTASRKLEQAAILDEPTSPVSIFSTPLSRAEVHRYLENYRGGNGAATPLRRRAATGRDHSTRPEPARLSA